MFLLLKKQKTTKAVGVHVKVPGLLVCGAEGTTTRGRMRGEEHLSIATQATLRNESNHGTNYEVCSIKHKARSEMFGIWVVLKCVKRVRYCEKKN